MLFLLNLEVIKEWSVGLPTNIEPQTYVKITLKDSDNDGFPDKYDILPYVNNEFTFLLFTVSPLLSLVRRLRRK